MTQRTIDGVTLGGTWSSWAGSAFAALRAAGMFEGDMTDLLGRTGFAFRFHINPRVCPSSATEFPWTDLPVYALDLLGVDSEAAQIAPPGMLREAAMRARAIARIVASIDRGRPVIVWAPSPVLEFGVLHGYDDAARTFAVSAYGPPDQVAPPLPYDALGRSEVPILFYQLVHDHTAVDAVEARRRALTLAAKLWTPDAHHPGRGKDGYAVMLDALRRNDINPFGLPYNLVVYADAKRHAATYLERLAAADALPGLDAARDAYAGVAQRFARACALFPFRGPPSSVDPAALPEAIEVLQQAAELEDAAQGAIARALAA